MIQFIKSVLKLITSLLIIIITPIIFILIWLSLTQTEWKNILKISEKQLQFLFPNYTITADSIITENINTTSFGSIYLKVNNFVFEDTKNNTIRFNIEKVDFSFSIFDIFTGKFMPIIHNAKKINIDVDVDKISKTKDKFDTQLLISYIANYIYKTVNYSLLNSSSKKTNIENINIKLNKNNKLLVNLLLNSNTTTITKKKVGFFENEDKVTYESNFSVDKIKSTLKLTCTNKPITNCIFDVKNVSIDSIFNEVNKIDDLQTKNMILDLNGKISINKNYITLAEGKLVTTKGLYLYNPKNNKNILFSDVKTNFSIKDNFKYIVLNDFLLTLIDGAVININSFNSDFIHLDRFTMFDKGGLRFKSHRFKLNDLYDYTAFQFGENGEKKLKNLLDNIFITKDANIEADGGILWEAIPVSNIKNKKFITILKNYDIDIVGSSKKINIPCFDNVALKNVVVDLNIKPKSTNIKIKNATIYDTNFEDTKINFMYDENNIKIDINEKNQNINSILDFLSHITGPQAMEKIGFLDVDKKSTLLIDGKIVLPITKDKQKIYNESVIDVSVKSQNLSSYYVDTNKELTDISFVKHKNDQILNIKTKFDKLIFLNNRVKTEENKNCTFVLPLFLEFNKNGESVVSKSNNSKLFCNNKLLLDYDFNFDDKNNYIDVKKIRLWNNDAGFTFVHNTNGYFFDVKGKNLNLIPFLTFFNNSYGKTNEIQKYDIEKDNNIINLKIKTDRMKRLRYVMDLFINKKDKFINSKNRNIDIKFNLENILMLNDYILNNVNANLSLTNKNGLLLNVVCDIKKLDNEDYEHIMFSVSKNNNKKDIYFRCSAINRLIKSLFLDQNSVIKHGDLTIHGSLDTNGNISGKCLFKDIFYNRKDALLFKNIILNNVSSLVYYNYKTNFLSFNDGKIYGSGIIGDFESGINLNNEYITFLMHVALGGSKYGLADIPILGNILTLSVDDNRYLSGFQYKVNGYLNQELDGSLTTLRGTSWLTGYFAMLAITVPGLFKQ